MSLKTLSEFTEESNRFAAEAPDLRDAEKAPPLVERLMVWLRECIAHGRYLAPMSPERQALQGLVNYWTTRLLQHDIEPPDDVDQLERFNQHAGVPLVAPCPYPGLEPYTDTMRGLFYGREEVVDRYVAHLLDKRILLIIGMSGSGKSSIALAGVLPALKERQGDAWLFTGRHTPATEPLAALASSVVAAAGQPAGAALTLCQELAARPSDALAILARVCGNKPLCVLIDQFEELFTLCRELDEQRRFSETLYALSAPDSRIDGFECRIVLTLRADHLARFTNSDELKKLNMRLFEEHNAFYVDPLGLEGIKHAIAEPARRCGLRFMPSTLIERLANQTTGLSNGLPLLQYALRRLWNTRPRDAAGQQLDFITNSMFNALPDVQGALGAAAERLFEKLTTAQQVVCERLFEELIVLDETFEEPLRRRRKEADLEQVLVTQLNVSAQDVQAVISKFADAGLLRRFGEVNQKQIEVAHEALLRHWPRMFMLVSSEATKDRLHLIKRIDRGAAEWVSRGKTEEYLDLRGERLARALKYRQEGWVAEAEPAAYVAACSSRELAEREKEKLAEEHKKRAEDSKRGAQRWRYRFWFVVGFVLIAILMLVKQREAARATLDASISLSGSLPAWEGIDVAYTLAKDSNPEPRFALAHELERMQNTTLLGDRMSILIPTLDASALLQFDRTIGREALRIYPVAFDGTPSQKPSIIPLNDRFYRLASAQVGGPIDGDKSRLVVLIVNNDQRNGFTAEVYRISDGADKIQRLNVDELLPRADNVSGINFDRSGTMAVFSAVDVKNNHSAIYRISVQSSDKVELVKVEDPAGTQAGLVTAVAFRQGATADKPGLITGHANGSVYCGSARMDVLEEPDTPGSILPDDPIRQIASVSSTEDFAVVHAKGTVRATTCAAAQPGIRTPLLRAAGTADSVTLAYVTAFGSPATVLSYVDGHHLRCYLRRDTDWQAADCNASHLVNSAVVLASGNQITVESPDVGAVHHYRAGAFVDHGKKLEGRVEGTAAIFWSAQASTNLTALHQTSHDHLPWQSKMLQSTPGHADALTVLLDGEGYSISNASLSPDGKLIAWIERAPPDATGAEATRVHRASTMDLGRDVVRAGAQGQQDALAISNSGHVAQITTDRSNKVRAWLDEHQLFKRDYFDTANIGCLAFSPDGNHLVMGTGLGLLSIFDTRGAGNNKSDDIDTREVSKNKAATRANTQAITACAIADDGTVVAGYTNGHVDVFSLPYGGRKPDRLTMRTVYALPVQLKQVAIEYRNNVRYVTALGDWQPNSCTRPGLPGQSLRIWELGASGAGDGNSPVAKACMPNETILALSSIQSGGSDGPGIELLTPNGVRWHACPGCTRPGETPEAVTKRLAQYAAAVGAEDLSPDDMKDRYGLRSAPSGWAWFPEIWSTFH